MTDIASLEAKGDNDLITLAPARVAGSGYEHSIYLFASICTQGLGSRNSGSDLFYQGTTPIVGEESGDTQFRENLPISTVLTSKVFNCYSLLSLIFRKH